MYKEKIESGKICLTKARKLTAVLTEANQGEWLAKAEALPKQALEKAVAAVSAEPVRECVRVIAEDRYALRVGISEELLKKLRRLQTLLSNQRKNPVNLEAAIEWSAEEALKKHDPLEKKIRPAKETAPEKMAATHVLGHVNVDRSVGRDIHERGLVHDPLAGRRAIPSHIKRLVLQRDHAACQYQVAGQKCRSTFFIHLHHRIPVQQGGTNSTENLVVLCQRHHHFWHEGLEVSRHGTSVSQGLKDGSHPSFAGET